MIEDKIALSNIFVLLIEKSTDFDHPKIRSQVERAKELKKPFFVITKTMIVVPERYLDGIEHVYVTNLDFKEDLPRIAKELDEFRDKIGL